MILGIEPNEQIKLCANLQAKKSVMRKLLKRKGVYKAEQNLSELQLKKLLTDSLHYCNLEIRFSVVPAIDCGSSRGENMVEIELIDAETGFGEASRYIMDGNMARYEAHSEAIRLWMANTMLVTFAREYEANSAVKKGDAIKATPEQVEFLASHYRGENLKKLLELNGIEKLEDISAEKADWLINKIQKVKGGK